MRLLTPNATTQIHDALLEDLIRLDQRRVLLLERGHTIVQLGQHRLDLLHVRHSLRVDNGLRFAVQAPEDRLALELTGSVYLRTVTDSSATMHVR